MFTLKYVLALILNYALMSNGLDADLVSPCPKLFVYRHQDKVKRLWYGTLIVETYEELFEVNSIRVILDREALELKIIDQLASVATVETNDNKEFLINGLQKYINKETKLSITVALYYRAGGPVPKLDTFSVNEIVTCSVYSYLTTTTSTTKRPLWSVASASSGVPRPGGSRPPPRPNVPPQRPFTPEETCGTRVNEVTPLIIGGHNSKRGEWPWHGALYFADIKNLNYQCGVTLVSKTAVITAAHCVTLEKTERKRPKDKLLIAFGRTRLSNWADRSSQNCYIKEIIVHPEYNSTNLHNDIAIIMLTEDVKITNTVRPACLWPINQDVKIQSLINRSGTVVGWGVGSDGEIKEDLQNAKIPVIDPLVCIYQDTNFYSQYTSPKSFCAGILGETSACNGDSGGGMVFKKPGFADVWQLRGVVSLAALNRESGICDINHYVVFTDVALYLDWLHRNIPDIR